MEKTCKDCEREIKNKCSLYRKKIIKTTDVTICIGYVMKNKYNAKAGYYDDIYFRSSGELNRYIQLKRLMKAGRVEDLELQPKYILQEKYKVGNEKIRALKYTADFRYLDKDLNKTVIEDFKGKKTKDYEIRKKLFIKKYILGSDLIFRESSLKEIKDYKES